MADEEIDYVSDPEEAKLSLKMRRREASDDEEEEEEQLEEIENRPASRRVDDSDGESEGGAADYEEDDLDEEDEEEDYDLEDEYVEEEEVEVVVVERRAEDKDGVDAGELVEESKGVTNDAQGPREVDDDEVNVDGEKNDEEKKDVEPYAVPTAGAFYMHDDRFRDNAGGRHRRMLGGRKLWESKDDRKWGHDKFEELTSKERHHDERRRGARGRGRGRGRGKGPDRVYVQGSRAREPREFVNNGPQNYNNNNNNHNNAPRGAPKGGRGRGPRRYQPSFKNDNDGPQTQNKQTGKSGDRHSYDNSLRSSEPTMSNADSEKPRKQVSSNLSVASPPFYPSSSSASDVNVSNLRDGEASTHSRNGQPSAVDENFIGQPSGAVRGKNKVGSVGMNNLYIDDSPSAMATKSANTAQMPGYSQGRGLTSLPQMSYQSTVPNNQANRARPLGQMQAAQRNSGQSRGQFPVQASAQQSTRSPSGTQVSSPPRSSGAVKNAESGEMESLSDSGTKTALVAKGKGMVQGSGRPSFVYGGPQVMGTSGNMGSGRGDPNFPTFLPVMQFGAQHQGGIGVPAVGMAFPGYVGGRGNSEMTWLPVLAGPAGNLGPNSFFQHITVDGSYNARPSGQASSITATSSKENTKGGNDWNPAQRHELATEETGQRQKNPRRYTEMKFDQ